jgi:hypothetical protein
MSARFADLQKIFAAACNVVETIFPFGRCLVTITLLDTRMAYEG